jgi:hypothetical protein
MNPTSELDETQLGILAFLLRHYPQASEPPVFESRAVLTGELRLALHEYDEACRGLISRRLIQTDPPHAHDCDSIALTSTGRQFIQNLRSKK